MDPVCGLAAGWEAGRDWRTGGRSCEYKVELQLPSLLEPRTPLIGQSALFRLLVGGPAGSAAHQAGGRGVAGLDVVAVGRWEAGGGLGKYPARET